MTPSTRAALLKSLADLAAEASAIVATLHREAPATEAHRVACRALVEVNRTAEELRRMP